MTDWAIGSTGRLEIFGAPIDAITMTEAVDRAFELAADPFPSQHVVLNAAKVVQMRDDPKLREIIAGCDMVNADGSSIVWASRLLGRPLPERVTGIDLFLRIVERAATTGHRLYFLGATDEVLERMLAGFRSRYPDLVIAGHRNGYWSDDELGQVIADVKSSEADFLFLAIPSPNKEYWLAEHLHELGVPFVMGVGGSFDVTAGLVQRAPTWVQHLGLEWLYRLSQEPKRMWRRYLVGNTRFLLQTSDAWIGHRFGAG